MADKEFKNQIKSAINCGDLEELQQLFSPNDPHHANIDIDMCLTGSAKTALMLAAREGHLRIVLWLVERGAQILLQDHEGRTALMRACERGHLEIVVYLVHRGADIMQWNVWGRTALLMAAYCGHPAVVNFLIASGSHTSGSSIDGKTALHIAIERNFAAVVSLLVNLGCSVHDKANSGESSIQLAAAKGNVHIIDILLEKGADITECLCAASNAGNIQVVKHLISLGADCNASDDRGWTPLMYGCAADQSATVACLITSGAMLNMDHPDVKSVIKLASGNCIKLLQQHLATDDFSKLEEKVTWTLRQKEPVRVVLDLLEAHGLQLDSILDDVGQNILFFAAAEGRSDVLSEILSSRGCDVNGVRLDGHSPLMVACTAGRLSEVALLLSYGADIHYVNKNKLNAILTASMKGNCEIVEHLIQLGADIESSDETGKTCLMCAAENGHLTTVSVLAAAGAHIEAKDRHGSIALALACKAGFLEVVQSLVQKHRADTDAVNLHGKPVISYAHEQEHYNIVSFLFHARARKSTAIIVKYLRGKNMVLIDIGLSCLEAVLPQQTSPSKAWHSPSTAASVLCNQEVVDTLKRLRESDAESVRHRAEALLKVSRRFQDNDIFSAILSGNWDSVMEVAEYGGAAVRDQNDFYPLHHLLVQGCRCSTKIILKIIDFYPAAASQPDPLTCKLPLVAAMDTRQSDAVLSSLVTAYPCGIDAIAGLSLKLQETFWSTAFTISALAADDYKLWLTMIQLTAIDHSSIIIFNTLIAHSELVYVEDKSGRRAYDLATPMNKKAMLSELAWHGRYSIVDELPEHTSTTSVVLRALDMQSLDECHAPKQVALKLMKFKSSFEAELLARRLDLDTEFVVDVLETYPPVETDLSTYPEAVDLDISTDWLFSKRPGERIFTVVMPWADRTMYMSLKHERFAGRNFPEIRHISSQLANALRHIHQKGLLHGDIKPLNIVRIGHAWKFLDLDACCRLGEDMQLHKYSSAYMPPEAIYSDFEAKFACVKSQENGTRFKLDFNLLPAQRSFDVWSLGCVLFQLCNAEVRPLFQGDRDDNMSANVLDGQDDSNLFSLALWRDELKRNKIDYISDPLAAHLISQMLSKDPCARPSLDRVLAHPFLTDNKRVGKLMSQEATHDVFLSYRERSDLQHAEMLYEKLSSCGLKVWFNQVSSPTGGSFEEACCDALINSRSFVCIMSRAGLASMEKLQTTSPSDSLLLQCRMALELQELGLLTHIIPVLVGDLIHVNDLDVYGKFFESNSLPRFPDLCVMEVEDKLVRNMKMQELGVPIVRNDNVSNIMSQITACQSALIEGEGKVAWNKAVDKINSVLTDVIHCNTDILSRTNLISEEAMPASVLMARTTTDSAAQTSHTESVDTESVNNESVDNESVDTESVDNESVDNESVDTESVDNESVDNESVDSESVDTESVERSDSVQQLQRHTEEERRLTEEIRHLRELNQTLERDLQITKTTEKSLIVTGCCGVVACASIFIFAWYNGRIHK